jgi:FixJ family two-component response regulator
MIKQTNENQSTVFVIDDDMFVREAVSSLLRSVGLQVKTFGSAQEFLENQVHNAAGCVVLDIRLPGISGLDCQTELRNAGIRTPIVFISGHADVPMSVQAMKSGAIEFLSKPFREQDLLDAVRIGLERDQAQREKELSQLDLRAHFESLTPRVQEVFGLVATGLMNKQIAHAIGVSEITVKVHRGNVMRKMGARSLAALVRMADALGLQKPRP